MVTRLGSALTAFASLIALAACGGGSGDTTPTPESTITNSPPSTATATGDPTASPLGADSPEVQQTLAMPGFADFAHTFQAAVDTNDRQFFIDHAYFQVPDCPSPGVTPSASPRFCMGVAAPPSEPAILTGAWNSEGDSVTAAQYEERVQRTLSPDVVPGAYVYAVGEQRFGLGFGSSELDIIVGQPGLLSTPVTSVPPDESVSAYRVDQVDGEWRIVGVDSGLMSLVPYFFKWYAPWDEVFPPAN